MRFVDSNVLLYSISTRPEDAERTERAVMLFRERDLALSVQVLQEFYVQATRPTSPLRISHDEAVAYMALLRRYPIQELSLDVVEAALAIKVRWQINYWDAAIVAAARAIGCDTLLTEDLQHGQDFGRLVVVNPFR